jgi:putative isomerase
VNRLKPTQETHGVSRRRYAYAAISVAKHRVCPVARLCRRIRAIYPWGAVLKQSHTESPGGIEENVMRQRPTWFWLSFAAVLQVSAQATPLAKPEAEPYAYTGRLSLDITKVPFSRYGSNLAFSQFTKDNLASFHGTGLPTGVYLRSVNGDQRSHPVFRLELLDADTPVPFLVEASPFLLRLKGEKGIIEICISASDRVKFRGHGVSLRLIAQDGALAVKNYANHWEVNSERAMEKYMLWATSGDLRVDAPWNGISNLRVAATFSPDRDSLRVAGEIDTYASVWTPHQDDETFDESLRTEERDYSRWLELMPEVPQELGRGAELAAYVNWTSVVDPNGFLDRPAMLMSKNWMAAIWSWDHCFTAMALSFKDPELGWQQYMLPFDNQQPEGALPDMIQSSWKELNFTKPPIHGWALAWMMQHGEYTDQAHLAQIYLPLSRWTNWFFQYRDSNRDGLPEYDHGYDSGWDNSTVMLSGVPVETADLDSFLILQMDTLAEIAGKLGKDADQQEWHSRSNELLKRMLETLWRKDHFVAIRSSDGAQIDSESLLLYVPIILGKRLPPDVRKKLIQGLTEQGRFLTPHGFATEPLTSKYYTPDGYWRGPIWAPVTMLLAEGLDSAGEYALAKKVREDFCRMAQRSGMYENFDASTGNGLRDPAYTWTSSIYLIFAHQLLSGRKQSVALGAGIHRRS